MERVPVKSSNLVSVGYDPAKKELEVEFRGGSVYTYHDVEPHHHEALMSAESHGTHLHQHIKGKFRWSRQTKPT